MHAWLRYTSSRRACARPSRARCAMKCGRRRLGRRDLFTCSSGAMPKRIRTHAESAAVKKFADILYPNCLAPRSSFPHRQVDANAAFVRVAEPS